MQNSQIRTEQAFMASMQETLKQGRKNGGRISRGEIEQIFKAFSLDETQLQQVEAYLQAHRIVVGSAGVSRSSFAQAGADSSAAGGGADSIPTDSLSVGNISADSGPAGTAADGKVAVPDALSAEEKAFLASYREMLADIPGLSDSVLEAVKISAMAGEPSAQKELSEQMLGTVVEIARLYAGQGVSMEDLIAAGNEALVTGVTLLGHLESPREVDGELGRRIMDSMEDMISMMLDDNAMDRELEDLVNLVADKAKELAGTLGRKVTAAELAREGEVTSDQIAEAVRLTGGKIEDLEG